MRILLFGKNGQIGWELQRTLAPLGTVTALGSSEADLRNTERLRELVRLHAPDAIINAAAYTAVDRAESEPDQAMAVNGTAPGVLAEAAREAGCALVHYSTDYVFDGAKASPYIETDVPDPLSHYGRTKLAGERAIEAAGGAYLILRTSWVYSLRRPSFVTKVLSWSRRNRTLQIVTDQVSGPTWCRALAEATALALAPGAPDLSVWLKERAGLYHLAAAGQASRLEWAQVILAHDPQPEARVAEELLPARSADFTTPAARPAYSALNSDRFATTFGLRLPLWTEMLQLAMDPGGGASHG